MSTPAILALATAVPETRYGQSDILEQYLQLQADRANGDRRIRAIYERVGISYRHTVVDGSYYTQERRTQARNERYLAEALPLGEAAIWRCLEAAGYAPDAVDDFFVVSCTGIDTPGLDLRLAGRMGMRPDLRRTCVLGMGCYAAFPGLLRAREAAAAQPGRLALMLAIELCSLHLQMGDSMENVIASALFADGAAAALVSDRVSAAGPCLLDSATHCDYQAFDDMTFELTDHGFQMRLSAYVPDLLAAKVEDFVDSLLLHNGLRRADVRFWGVHPGSSKILDHIQARLKLTDTQIDYSRAVLRDYGNMSSPTILFVLDEIQRSGRPSPGDYGVLLAFGPGLTMEGMLIQW